MKLGIVRTPEDDAGGPSLDLEKAIAEFYADFPEHKKDVFILNHQKFPTGWDAVKSITDKLDAVKTECPEAKLPLAKSLAAGMFAGKLPCSVNIGGGAFTQKPEDPIFARIVIPAGDEFSARLMKSIFVSNDPVSNASFPVMKDEYNNTEMWHRYVLDHELGHAVTQLSVNKQAMKVSSLGNRAECEADTYAMIRHYQRYGHDSTFPEYLADIRNMNAVQKGDVTHWTTRALDELIQMNKDGKLDNLTPQQARDLAVDIAARNHLSADAEYNMQNAFAETVKITQTAQRKKTPDGQRVMSYLDKACEIAAETKSPATLEACKRYVSTIKHYIPDDLAQDRTPEQIKAMAANLKKANERELKEEPPMTGLKRVFRDAIIDVQSGKKEGPPPDKKLPYYKKPKKPGF
ncbi:MAG: hypothetical protein EPN97_13065 [Alphaproteobacteria bacterium]|nr:MAG: hypothetical protein EPN97_13065 [Alphaproteobacteria bacterium]